MRTRLVAPLALIVANLVPLVGVLFYDWRLLDVMMVYWLENGVIGTFNLARMVTAGRAPAAAVFFGPFFTVHYGMFWLVHGVFVVTLFGPGGFVGSAPGVPDAALVSGSAAVLHLPITGAVPLSSGVLWAVASVALSHGASFVQNWFLGGERRRTSPADLMRRPYARVLVLHVTLLAGGFAVTALGRPVLALVLMVLLKIAMDVRAHRAEHRAPAAAGGGRRAVSAVRAR